MGKLIKFALVVAIAYGAYIAFIQPDWYPAGSPEDGFTMEFPGNPKRDSQRQRIEGLGLTTITDYYYRRGNNMFLAIALSSKKIREGRIDQEQITELMSQRFAKRISGRLVATTSGTHKGVPYVEFEFRIDKSSATMYMRYFVTNGRIFSFGAASTTMGRMTSGRGRFFRSVRFTGQ